MECTLCKKEIKNYNIKFHHLLIDDDREVDVCSNCSDKIIKWQSNIIAELFPTKMMKKRKK